MTIEESKKELKWLAILFTIGIVVRCLTNMTSYFIDDDKTFTKVMYNGVLFFESFALIVAMFVFKKYQIVRYFVDIAFGGSVYALIKFNYLNPQNVETWEYLGSIIGLSYLVVKKILTYVYVSLFKRNS